MRVRPVHVVSTVVVHVNQLMGQHCPHLLLSQGEVGADEYLVVSEVIPTVSGQWWSVVNRETLASPSSQTSLTGLTDDVSSEVKLTALTLQSSDQSPHQGGAESPGYQDLALSASHHFTSSEMIETFIVYTGWHPGFYFVTGGCCNTMAMLY